MRKEEGITKSSADFQRMIRQPIFGQPPVPRKTEFELRLERENVKIQALTYPDGTFRLFKPGQILGEDPAGYSEENVIIKLRVTRPGDDYVVILPVSRTFLDQPEAKEQIAIAAYNWRK